MNVLQTQSELAQANMTGAMAAFGVGQPSVTLTIRLIMQGKEVGSIIGKKGDNIKRFREESGAKITISDGSCPERIVTVTGSTEAILKAFALIARKFEEVSSVGGWLDLDPSGLNPLVASHSQLSLSSVGTAGNGQNGKSNCSLSSAASMMAGQPPVTLKLIVPASQCGSLIGKGGAKIKEIRETTGASIQVASEMLPNSTERAVTLSGTAEAITKSIYQICCVMLESPPKGPTIPYRPKPAMPPVFFAGGQAYTIQGQFAIPHPDLTKLHRLALQHAPLLPGHAGVGSQLGSLSPQATLATLASPTASLGHAATAAAAANAGVVPTLTTEMTIPNDIIGSVIGKGGAKINEIRQLSGATIKINNSEDGSKDRTVLISGTPEAINLAQYLIATRMINSSHNAASYGSQPAATGNTAGSSSSPSSSDSSTAGGPSSYGQSSQQQLQYALLYKNYLQPYLQQQYNAYYANGGAGSAGTGAPSASGGSGTGPHYYSTTSGSAVQHASYVNGGGHQTAGNGTAAAGNSSRSSSNSSSEAAASGLSQHLFKTAESHSSGHASSMLNEASTGHGSHGHGHQQQYEYEPIAYHHHPMLHAASAANYAPSIASMGRF